MGSYAELTEEDFEDRRTQEAAFWGDPNPLRRTRDELSSSPPPAARKKRASPDTLSSTSKRSKLNDYDIEVIDLTDSPPKRPMESTYDSWESSYSSYSSKPRSKSREDSYSQLLTDLFTSTTSHKPPPIPKFTLQDCSPEQRNILELVSQGKNVFFTGSAGVGKSFVLEKICQLFQSQGRKQFIDFFVTASTGTPFQLFIKDVNVGIAAVHIGGMTVHSFAGIGKGEDGIIDLKKKAKKTRRINKHWKECRTLIIDEVSMVPPISPCPKLT